MSHRECDIPGWIAACVAAAAVLVGLKISGRIDCPWPWALAPLLVPPIVVLAIVATGAAVCLGYIAADRLSRP